MREEMKRIMDKEELFDWNLEKSLGGWLTLPKSKKILLKNYNHFSLFLHEVAHAKVCKKGPKNIRRNHHGVLWGDEYTDLVNKYTIPNKGLIKLLKNKLVSWKP